MLDWAKLQDPGQNNQTLYVKQLRLALQGMFDRLTTLQNIAWRCLNALATRYGQTFWLTNILFEKKCLTNNVWSFGQGPNYNGMAKFLSINPAVKIVSLKCLTLAKRSKNVCQTFEIGFPLCQRPWQNGPKALGKWTERATKLATKHFTLSSVPSGQMNWIFHWTFAEHFQSLFHAVILALNSRLRPNIVQWTMSSDWTRWPNEPDFSLNFNFGRCFWNFPLICPGPIWKDNVHINLAG